MRLTTIKILEHSNSFDIGHSNFLLDVFPEARETKAKINYEDFHQNKKLLHSEGNNKTKRQPTEWEKIFVNDMSDKGIVSKIYKELAKLNTQRTNNPVKKMGRRYKQTFYQRRHIHF